MLSLAFIAITAAFLSPCAGNPTVTFQSGTIQGCKSSSTAGKPYDSYESIPFASPPVNDLRFKPPVPPPKWNGVRNGCQVAPICPQISLITNKYSGDEDCLYLNVYTPQKYINSNKLLSVMLYIHGGAFLTESGNSEWYGPQNYMDFPVVLVTINYRMGVFGFLCTSDSSAYGNNGMLDQVLALKWVQDNIKYFGGDKQQVTIFGNSAGSMSVFFHLLSPLSKGLFSKAICESGVGISPFAIQLEPLALATFYANKLHCSTSSSKEIVSCISEKSSEELIAAQQSFMISAFVPPFWLPVIETPGGPGFLTENPASIIANKRMSNEVPVLSGVVAMEGYTFVADLANGRLVKYFENQFSLLWPLLKPFKAPFTYIVSKVLTEVVFNINADRASSMLSDAGLPVFVYRYTYISEHCLASVFNYPCGIYSGHADEIYLQFRFLSPKTPMNEKDTKMSYVINSFWVEFATKTEVSIANGVFWPKYDKSHPQYVELNLKPVIKDGNSSFLTSFSIFKIPQLIEEFIHSLF